MGYLLYCQILKNWAFYPHARTSSDRVYKDGRNRVHFYVWLNVLTVLKWKENGNSKLEHLISVTTPSMKTSNFGRFLVFHGAKLWNSPVIYRNFASSIAVFSLKLEMFRLCSKCLHYPNFTSKLYFERYNYNWRPLKYIYLFFISFSNEVTFYPISFSSMGWSWSEPCCNHLTVLGPSFSAEKKTTVVPRWYLILCQ